MLRARVDACRRRERAPRFRAARALLAAALALALPAAAQGGALDAARAIALYVPNRALDLVDVVRLRLRVGPGLAVGARATELADVFLGSYAAVWAGLPGPRGEGHSLPRLPAGVAHRSGVEVGPVDAAPGAGAGPDFTPTEVGVDLHPFLLGVQAGFDPVEIVDLAAGLVFLDLRDDDL